LDTTAIDAALDAKGTINGGVYQVNIPRAEVISEAGMTIPPSLGTAIAINLQPTGAAKRRSLAISCFWAKRSIQS